MLQVVISVILLLIWAQGLMICCKLHRENRPLGLLALEDSRRRS